MSSCIKYYLHGYSFMALYGRKRFIRVDMRYDLPVKAIRDLGISCYEKSEREHKGVLSYKAYIYPGTLNEVIARIVKTNYFSLLRSYQRD